MEHKVIDEGKEEERRAFPKEIVIVDMGKAFDRSDAPTMYCFEAIPEVQILAETDSSLLRGIVSLGTLLDTWGYDTITTENANLLPFQWSMEQLAEDTWGIGFAHIPLFGMITPDLSTFYVWLTLLKKYAVFFTLQTPTSVARTND